MTHPTDDELERVAKDCTTAAQVMREAGTFETGQSILDEAAAMLRACKGRVKPAYSLADLNALSPEQKRSNRDAAFAERGWTDPAPDHSDWNAAIEAAAKVAEDARTRNTVYEKSRRDAAAAIRALKKGSPPE